MMPSGWNQDPDLDGRYAGYDAGDVKARWVTLLIVLFIIIALAVVLV